MRSYLSTQDIIDDDERISAKSIVKRQANLNEQTKLLKIFGAISGADNTDNLIFTDEEVDSQERLDKLSQSKVIVSNEKKNFADINSEAVLENISITNPQRRELYHWQWIYPSCGNIKGGR